MRNDFIFRVRVVYFVFIFFALFIAGRLFLVQVVRGSYYKQKASDQYIAPSADYFDRGVIYFEKNDGQLISAATVKKGYLLAISPKNIKNPEFAYKKIKKILAPSGESNVEDFSSRDDFLRRAGKTGDPYEEVAHKLSKEQAEAIRALKLRGVNVYSESWRFYPAKTLASRELGFVGYKGNKLTGRYGLEKYYNDILSRNNPGEKSVNSFAEIFMGLKKIISNDSKEGDIAVTIEPMVQSILEINLEKVLKKYKAVMAGGIIIEPSTGKILAMSAKPNFNPNRYGKAGNLSLFLNPGVQSVFEMGSIMKPLTLSASMDMGAISPTTVYDDKGYVILNGRRIENYDGRGRGRVDMQQVLDQSLNTGAIFAMEQMGKEEFKKYLINYGFGEKTGIDLPDEVPGMISNLNSGREVEFATASFGQGIAITPIEMITAISALANGGLLMRPYVVEEIKNKEGVDKKIEPKIRRRVLKKETSEKISRMLVKVVDDALLGGTVKLKNYTIAAKTGTAQLHKEGGRGYYKNEYVHTFFGYAPAFGTKFVVLLYLVKPQGVRYASHSLTEPFMNIVKFMINYYKIRPDR